MVTTSSPCQGCPHESLLNTMSEDAETYSMWVVHLLLIKGPILWGFLFSTSNNHLTFIGNPVWQIADQSFTLNEFHCDHKYVLFRWKQKWVFLTFPLHISLHIDFHTLPHILKPWDGEGTDNTIDKMKFKSYFIKTVFSQFEEKNTKATQKNNGGNR